MCPSALSGATIGHPTQLYPLAPLSSWTSTPQDKKLIILSQSNQLLRIRESQIDNKKLINLS